MDTVCSQTFAGSRVNDILLTAFSCNCFFSQGVLRAIGLSSATRLARGMLALFLSRITLVSDGDNILIKSGLICKNKNAVTGDCEGRALPTSLWLREPLAGTEIQSRS